MGEGGAGSSRADFVLGDRDGTTCDPAFTEFMRATLAAMGYVVAVNDPYKGVELVRAYSDPARRRHSLQVEINKRLYMNEATRERHEGFVGLQARLAELLGAVQDYIEREQRRG
jgi:N-formylglutamate amidohydrolase